MPNPPIIGITEFIKGLSSSRAAYGLIIHHISGPLCCRNSIKDLSRDTWVLPNLGLFLTMSGILCINALLANRPNMKQGNQQVCSNHYQFQLLCGRFSFSTSLPDFLYPMVIMSFLCSLTTFIRRPMLMVFHSILPLLRLLKLSLSWFANITECL